MSTPRTPERPSLRSIIGPTSKNTTTTSPVKSTKPTSTPSTPTITPTSRHTNSACGNPSNTKNTKPTTTKGESKQRQAPSKKTPKTESSKSSTSIPTNTTNNSNNPKQNIVITTTRVNIANLLVKKTEKKDENKQTQTPPKKTPKTESPKSTVIPEANKNSSNTTEEVKLELPKISSSDKLNQLFDEVEKQKIEQQIEQQKKQQEEEKIKSLELKNNKDDLITNFHTYEKVKNEIEALDKAINASNDALIIFAADHLKRNHGLFSNARSAETVKQNEEKITKGKAALKYAFTILVTVSEEKSTDYSNTLERIAKLRNVLIKDGFIKYNDKSRSEGFKKIYDFALLGQLDNRLGALQEIYQKLSDAMKASDFDNFKQEKAKIVESNKKFEIKL